jgi:hypothetical protein
MSHEDFDNTKVNGVVQRAIEALLLGTRPIAYHAALARSLKSATAGIFLSQLLYWTPRTHNRDGWIWKTRDDIYQETALTRYEQESARKILKRARILEERLAGVPARMHFRIDLTELIKLLGSEQFREPEIQLVENPPTGWRETNQLGRGKPTNKTGGKQPTFHTETTTETTPENKAEISLSNREKNQKRGNRTSNPPTTTPQSQTPQHPARQTPPANILVGPAASSRRGPARTVPLEGPGGFVAVGQTVSQRSAAVTQGLAPQAVSVGPRRANPPPAGVDSPSGGKTAVGGSTNPQEKRKRGRPRNIPTEYLDAVMKDFSAEFHDSEHLPSNQSQARRLLKATGLSEEALVGKCYQARSLTRDRANISKTTEGTPALRNKMPYFFACLRDLLDLPEEKAGTNAAQERMAL